VNGFKKEKDPFVLDQWNILYMAAEDNGTGSEKREFTANSKILFH
jgi:hypothetical protein